ncbi:MAG: Uma2 family endonuclease [Planctomycetes bacterium]|nr:Uma2 family endonuclease [Planctomycetota bacterium]
MASVSTLSPTMITLADLLDRLGGIPLHRIRIHPSPGTATVQDVLDLEQREGKLFELVEGVLVEKAVGFIESGLAGFLLGVLNAFVLPRNLGIVTGEAGTVELMPGLVRIPDVAFTRWERLPGRRYPTAPIPRLAPNLAVEVLSQSNTPGEMAAKRQDYFTAGVELVWEIDPDLRTVAVYTSTTQVTSLTAADTLEGGSVLPGFTLPLQELFAELDRHG